MSRKPSVRLQQPVNPEAIEQEEERWQRSEKGAHGRLDGRFIKRRSRDVQIGLKTTDERKKQFDRLRMLTGLSYVEIFEAGLDAFEREWNSKQEAAE